MPLDRKISESLAGQYPDQPLITHLFNTHERIARLNPHAMSPMPYGSVIDHGNDVRLGQDILGVMFGIAAAPVQLQAEHRPAFEQVVCDLSQAAHSVGLSREPIANKHIYQRQMGDNSSAGPQCQA